MFMNKVSVKDLFSTNSLQQDSSDSAVDSGSQNNYSQFPFSQLDDSQLTQDFGSQHSSQSPSKKFYQRYSSASKAQLFPKEGNLKQQTQGNRLSGNQQLQINKARAKERDERDILQTLAITVQDCTAEVKGIAVMVNETLQDGTLKSEEKLKEYLEKIQAGLTKYNDNLVQYLQKKDTSDARVLELAKEVAEKDGRIAELEKQLATMKKENFDKLLEDMEDIYKGHHNDLQINVNANMNEQQKVLNEHTQQQEKYLQKLLQSNNNHTTKVVEQFKNKTLALVDEKFEAGIASQMKILKKELSREVQDEIYGLQSEHRQKIEELINQHVEQLRCAGVESQNKLMEKQKQHLQRLQNRHRERLENLINQKVTAANMEQKSQLEIWVEQLWREEKKRTDAQHYEQMKHFREQIRRYYEQTLEELKERHIREVESIKAQQRVQFDRDGTHANSRFPTSSRLPYSSFESNNSGMGAQRRKSAEYYHNSRHRRFRSLSPDQQLRNNPNCDYDPKREKYHSIEYPARDYLLNRSPALCNVVDPVMLSPKPYPRTPGNNLDKLFSKSPVTTGSSYMSPLNTVGRGLKSKMLFSNSLVSPVNVTKEYSDQSEQSKTNTEESQSEVRIHRLRNTVDPESSR